MEQLVVFLVLIATNLASCEEDNCRMLQFFSPIDGSTLENHVIRKIVSNSEHFCRVQCYLENVCVSYNFGMHTSSDGLCELNNSTHLEHPHDLKHKSSFIYRGAENFCSSEPCRNGGSCQSGFSPRGYRCLCREGFTGSQCDININECASHPCQNGGTCRDLVNGFKCDCPVGVIGTRCQTVIPECSMYKVLNGSDRHQNHGVTTKKCDNNITETSWYRFSGGAGTKMASSCPQTHKCNTDLTGWMDGSNPTVEEGVVARKVCFHGYSDCCHKSVEINVRNCGPFFIYKLKKLTSCNLRYCGSD